MSGREPWFADLGPRFADDALEIICEECGFDPDESAIYQFRRAVIEAESHNVEYRFIGALGFGGKFHLHLRHFSYLLGNGGDYRCYVSCYSEDKTPERAAMIEGANLRLTLLCDEYHTNIRAAISQGDSDA